MKLLIFLLPSLLFASFNSVVLDSKTHEPLKNVQIIDEEISVYSDINGSFDLNTTSSTLLVKLPGYKLKSIDVNSSEILLERFDVKALYLSHWGASPRSKTYKRLLNHIETTPINALIIDVKNETGITSYKTSVSVANKMGAFHQRTIKDIESYIKSLKDKDVYLIARIVVFKDDLRAQHYPKFAIKADENGTLWRNHQKLAWMDPSNEATHQYVLDIAKDAAKMGFDEVNFDYIRFPARSGLCYTKACDETMRVGAVNSFLSKAKAQLRKYGTFISVDTYGYIAWNYTDTNIGQRVEELEKNVDYLSPMLYPSGFSRGNVGFADPTLHNYDVVHKSILEMHDRIEPLRIRPWLQAFKDYGPNKRFYRAKEIKEQIDASEDANASGWMLWNPSSRYRYVGPEMFKKEEAFKLDSALEQQENIYFPHCDLKALKELNISKP